MFSPRLIEFLAALQPSTVTARSMRWQRPRLWARAPNERREPLRSWLSLQLKGRSATKPGAEE